MVNRGAIRLRQTLTGKSSQFEDAKLEGMDTQDLEVSERAKERTAEARSRLAQEALDGRITPERAEKMQVANQANSSLALNKLLVQMTPHQQPQYAALDDAYKKTQIDVLGKSPLEEQIEREQRERDLKVIDELAKQTTLNQQQLDALRNLASFQH
jgi:hypothetical protein